MKVIHSWVLLRLIMGQQAVSESAVCVFSLNCLDWF